MRVGKKSDSEIREKLAKMKGDKGKAKKSSSSPAPSFPLGVEPNAKQNNKLRKINNAKKAAQAKKQQAAQVDLSKKAKKKELTKDEVSPAIKSDVGLNQPDDPATKEKLKGLIQNGGFSFSDKERKALADILKA